MTFLSTDEYINLFYVCFCLKIPELIYILLNSWTVNPQLVASTTAHVWRKIINTSIFPIRRITAFLHSEPRQRVSIMLGAILSREITNKEDKKILKSTTNTTAEKTLVYTMRNEKRRQRCLVCPQLGARMSSDWNFSSLCTWFWMTMKAPWVLIWGSQINYLVGKFSNTESVNNEAWLHIFKLNHLN